MHHSDKWQYWINGYESESVSEFIQILNGLYPRKKKNKNNNNILVLQSA